jgi:hypothetical protein
VRRPLARPSASADATDSLPVAIARSGHGGPAGSKLRRGGTRIGGSQRHGAGGDNRKTVLLAGSAAASAKHCFSIPAVPSLKTQQV